MAGKYTKIPKSIYDIKSFLEYNYDEYTEAAKHIRQGEGWNVKEYADEVFDIIYNLQANFYEESGLYHLLQKENPASDKEIISKIQNIYNQFEPQNLVFDKIIAKKPANEKVLGLAEGIVHELLYKALLKLSEVLELIDQELNPKAKKPRIPAKLNIKSKSATLNRAKISNIIDFEIYNIAIITVTDEEMSAVKTNIPNLKMIQSDALDDDSGVYYSGTLECNPKVRFIVAQAPHQGIPSASSLTTKIVLKFKPRLVAMLGHAAGNKNLISSLKLGHILIAEEAVNYNQIHYIQKKISSGENEFVKKDKKNVIDIEHYFKSKLKDFYTTPGILDSIRDSYPNKNYFEQIDIHIGKIVTGDSLMSSQARFDEIISDNPNTIGLDMETYGVYYAAKHTLHSNKPFFVAIKSVSDFGSHQTKFEINQTTSERQKYACHTSVKFFIDFCCTNNLP